MVQASVIERGWADKVAGMCVGGPFDGQQRVERGPVFEYIERTPFMSPNSLPPENVPVCYKRGRYIAHMVCGTILWVPDTLSLEWAIAHMAAVYAVPHHLRKPI